MRVGDPLRLVGRRILDRYTILRPMAEGGMSVIYVAEDDRLRREVCVKVFSRLDPSQDGYRTTYEHFVQEAFALSQLQHPNTLRIYDFGYLLEEPRSPFHVSELIRGGTLHQHIRLGGALSQADALEILEPVVGALGEAHARGIIHRDLKPANILLGQVGKTRVVKLADFGIAKATPDRATPLPHQAEDTHVADGPVSLYSLGWAAPEQLTARPVGPTADVYALGLITAYMLAGRKVFAEQDWNRALDQRLHGEEHVRRALIDLGLTGPIVDVIARACRTDPCFRYPSADQFFAACEQALERGQPAADGGAPDPLEAADAPTGRVATVLQAAEQVDLVNPDLGNARLRLTMLPDARGLRLHVRGLNCFLSAGGSRPSRAMHVVADLALNLLAIDRTPLDTVRCIVGAGRTASWTLDFGPGRSVLILQHHPGKRPS